MEAYKVLVVDDEYIIRRGIRECVHGLQTPFQFGGEARNGQEALEKMADSPCDIIVSDVRMPVMDGLAMAERLYEQQHKLPIIFLSGYSDVAYLRGALRYEAIDYLLKPIDPGELIASLERAAQRLSRQSLLQRMLPAAADEVSRRHVVDAVREIIHAEYATSLSVDKIAQRVHFSKNYLCTVFKETMGETINGYLTRLRIERSRMLLEQTNMRLYEVGVAVGYRDHRYFREIFTRTMGISPSEYRAQHRGVGV